MMDSSVTVTRNGDQFTYRHKLDKEPTDVSLRNVFQAANRNLDVIDRASSALHFLAESLEMLANHGFGKGLDEYKIRGLSALCDVISDSLVLDYEDRRDETSII